MSYTGTIFFVRALKITSMRTLEEWVIVESLIFQTFSQQEKPRPRHACLKFADRSRVEVEARPIGFITSLHSDSGRTQAPDKELKKDACDPEEPEEVPYDMNDRAESQSDDRQRDNHQKSSSRGQPEQPEQE